MVILVLIMLFLLPILDSDNYVDETLIFSSSIALLVNIYNDGTSWEAYKFGVE